MTSVPSCAFCSKKLRLAPKYIRERGRAFTADGAPPQFGYEGNNLVCSSRCGMLVAISLVAADPGVLSILPDGWNKRGRRSA